MYQSEFSFHTEKNKNSEGHNLLFKLGMKNEDNRSGSRWQFRLEENKIIVRSPIKIVGSQEISLPSLGEEIGFFVDTCPSTNKSDAEWVGGKRVRHSKPKRLFYEVEDWPFWFGNKLGGCLDLLEIGSEGKEQFESIKSKQLRYYYSFYGKAIVRDLDEFSVLCANGIGPLKAYGLGMFCWETK